MKDNPMKIKDIFSKVLFWISILLLAVYVGMFAYLNIAKFDQHADSDIAAEALLAKTMWEDKSFTPDYWIPSSERHNVGAPLVAAFLYGMTGNLSVSAGLACTILGCAFTFVLYRFLRKNEFSRLASVLGVLVLYAIPINGIKWEGQLIPFVHQLLFLFADYYVLHTILLFAAIMFYVKLQEKGITKKGLLQWSVLFVFTIGLSLCGQRCMQNVILPLLLVEVISLFVETEAFSSKISKARLLPTGFVLSLLVGYFLAGLYPGQIRNGVGMSGATKVTEKLTGGFLKGMFELFGIEETKSLTELGSIMQTLVYLFLALVIMGVCIFLSKKSTATIRQKKSLMCLSISFAVTVVLSIITEADIMSNYYYVAWFIALYIVAFLVDYFDGKKAWFKELIVVAVCGFAILNIGYTYAEAITTEDNLAQEQEVADFLLEEGIDYGYGMFWDAGRIALLTDGEVKMGHSYTMTDVKMQWWLTDLRWYPPNISKDMETAYVVRQYEKAGFEAWYGEGLPEIAFENDKFVVYVGNENKVHLP